MFIRTNQDENGQIYYEFNENTKNNYPEDNWYWLEDDDDSEFIDSYSIADILNYFGGKGWELCSLIDATPQIQSNIGKESDFQFYTFQSKELLVVFKQQDIKGKGGG